MQGQPDFAALGYKRSVCPRLLFIAESKTRYTLPIPPGITTTELWHDPSRDAAFEQSVQQAYGYMVNNKLKYGMLTSGEVFVFMRRNRQRLELTDVHRTGTSPTPMAAIYYLMQL